MPNVNNKLGQEVSKYRTLLDSVRVDVISFGVMKNKSLCTSSMKFPISMQKQFSKENIGILDKILPQSYCIQLL